MPRVRAGIVHQPHGQTALQHLLLEQVTVHAWVVDVSSRIVLTQTYYNPSNEHTGRAKYVFPLPARAAVCAFELELEDGSVVVGEVKEKEEAALMFHRAVEQGRTTALVERVTEDVFTISVGSIPATTRVIARLTFVMDLLNEGLRDHVRLQLPMHVAERFGTPPAALQDASAVDSRTRVYISVDIQTNGVIYEIGCPTHQGVLFQRYRGRSGEKSQRRASAVWTSSEFLMNDFVITIYAEGLDKPRCFAEVLSARENGDGAGSTVAMQLTLVPKFLAPKIPSQEYIFIIDRSSSMTNDPIETAKRTLTMLLRLLPGTQTTFNIFSFGTTVQGLWRSSRALDSASLSEATAHVASMSANLGMTHTPKALQAAFNSRRMDRPAVVFLLTDGLIHVESKAPKATSIWKKLFSFQRNETLDPWAVVSNAIRNSPPAASVRLFVLGIGPNVSSDVCDSLSRQGNGEYVFALAAEEIVGKCARLLNAGRSKNIERIDVDWGRDARSGPGIGFSSSTTPALPAGIVALAPPPPIQQAPHALTRIFSGIRFTVVAITSFTTVPTSVKLITKLEGVSEPLELTVAITKVKPFRNTTIHSIIPIIHTLAARRLIMEMKDGIGPLPAPDPRDALLASENDLRRAGIVRLGLTYQLVSGHTSFIAVREGDEQLRRRRRGNAGWARSGLVETSPSVDTEEDRDSTGDPTEDPTFLDSLIDAVTSFVGSVFDLLVGPVASTTITNTTSPSGLQNQPTFPGAYNASDTSVDEDDRGRGCYRTFNPTNSRSVSRSSIGSFSSLSSLGRVSLCSACLIPSRPSSPQSHESIERAPSPAFLQDSHAPGSATHPDPGGVTRPRPPISQEVYDLIHQMEVDGSFSPSQPLARLVGDAVLRKANERGIDNKVWATAVVVAYMRVHLQGEPDLMELVSEKAKEFIEGRALGGEGSRDDEVKRFERMIREAAHLLGP